MLFDQIFALIKLNPNSSEFTEISFEIWCPSGQFVVGHLLAHSMGYDSVWKE